VKEAEEIANYADGPAILPKRDLDAYLGFCKARGLWEYESRG